MRELVIKLFPKLYLSLAYIKNELFEEYWELKKQNLCKASFFKYFVNYIFQGVTPTEYNLLDFANLNKKGKSSFITMRKNRKIDRKYNSKKENDILWDKEKFNDFFCQFINRKWIYISSETTKEQIESFYNSLTEKKFIIKPNRMYYGKGITIGTMVEELYDAKIMGGVIVEELVENEKSLKELNPTSLNTCRVVTCVDKNKKPHIVTIVLRTGSKGAIIDNARGGGSFYHIDLGTGIIDSPGRDSYGNYYVIHPTSEIVMPGFKIPRFNDLKQYSIDLASKLPNARYVGWDIAVTPNGFEIIEGNVCPSSELIQCNNVGLYNKIKYYLEN